MRPPFAPALAAATLFALAAAPAAAQDVRWKFAAGDAHVYAFDLTVTAKITQFGQASETKTALKIVQSWDVKSVNADGSAVVNRTIDRVTIDSDAGGTETHYDSAADSPGAGAVDPKTLPADFPVIAQLAGRTIPSVIAADGTVKKVTLPEAVTQAIEAAGPGSAFGEKQVELLFTDRGYALPPAGAEVGDTYTDEAVLPLQFGEVKDARTMTLKALTDESAVIDFKTVLSDADEAAGPMSVAGGTTAGTVTFDVAAGRLAEADTAQTIDLTGPGGFQVNLVSESKFARTGD